MKPVNQTAELLNCAPSRDASVQSRIQLPGRHTVPRAESLGSQSRFCRSEPLIQFVKFAMVGGSGLFVDMGVLYFLADPRALGLNVSLSKICAAEAAMINNF